MKSFGKCKGCSRRKLVNLMRLCKRCNKEAHKYLTKEEMDSILKEHAGMAAEKAKAAAEKAEKDAAKTEEGSGGEDSEGSEEAAA